MAINEYVFDLPLRNEAELRLFCSKAFGASLPDVQVCTNHTTPWKAFCDAYFARSPVVVWHAARGFGGKSYMLALLGLVEAVTLGVDVSILGGSGEQSENVSHYINQFWHYEGAPTELLADDPSKREIKLAGGNRIRALMASQTSVRGPHPVRLRADEVDSMKLEILDAALGQPMSKDGVPAQTVISSTWQNADGTMTEVLKRAAEKGWPCYRWCFEETSQGWLDPAEIERKRNEVTAAMWATEFCLHEPAPESRAIQPEAVEAMFCLKGGGLGSNGQYIEIEKPEWEGIADLQLKGEYVTGADWAKKTDWTVIVTIRTDCSPARVVAFERCGRLPWPVMVAKYNDRVKRYPGKAIHDGTGIGDVVDGYLEVKAIPFMMVGKARSDMLSDYIGAVERGEVQAPMIEFMYNEHKYASVDDVYGAGHLPDSIAAMALAWHGKKTGRGVYIW